MTRERRFWHTTSANSVQRKAVGTPGKRTFTHLLPVQRRATTSDVQGVAQRGVAGASDALPHGDVIQASFAHHDVSHVRAAVGGAGGDAAQAIGARAYATGD